MKKRKLKKNVKKILYKLLIFISIFFLILFLFFKWISNITSFEHKLEKKGYTKDQIQILLKLDNNSLKDIIKRDYNKEIPIFVKQDYFLIKNLDSYIEYRIKNTNKKYSYIVKLINVKANNYYYDEKIINKTDTSKDILMLVNKYNYLENDYIPDVVEVDSNYAYDKNYLRKEALDAFIKMADEARKNNLNIVASTSYRDFNQQQKIYDNILNSSGKYYADMITSRPGFSEHQTGLAIDIQAYNVKLENFKTTEECKWLIKNSYKYGFIQRYPEDLEDLTGFNYEPWHYRYVGIDVAKKIHELNISFDEYYAYFLENS